jgi:hypothetical protein
MRGHNPLPALVGGTLVVAVLCTLLVQGGWLIWSGRLFSARRSGPT